MESWSLEVESGKSITVVVGEGKVLYLTQASLGEFKKETKKSVVLHITENEKKSKLGTLNSERQPQQLLNFVFDKDFQISHNWKKGSVFLYGYQMESRSYDHDDSDAMPEDSDDDEDINAGSSDDEEGSDEEEETPTPKKQSGKKRPNEAASK